MNNQNTQPTFLNLLGQLAVATGKMIVVAAEVAVPLATEGAIKASEWLEKKKK